MEEKGIKMNHVPETRVTETEDGQNLQRETKRDQTPQ